MQLTNKRIAVTGGHGFVGSWVLRALEKERVKKIYAPSSEELDLREKTDCARLVKNQDVVIHLAAYVGGIGLNKKHPGKLFYDNAIMGIELLEACRNADIKKVLITGTACSYPKDTSVPFQEKNFWQGYPEEVTGVYGIAKKMLLTQAEAYRTEYSLKTIYIIPTNMYGPGDNDDPNSGHVIPSLINRMITAKKKNQKEFVVWGSGQATRDFLYVEDAAAAIVQALKEYDEAAPLNIGSGQETPIRELVQLLKRCTGYKGKIVWDAHKPDGQKRRVMDIVRAKTVLGFEPKTSLAVGLQKTVDAYLKKIRNS